MTDNAAPVCPECLHNAGEDSEGFCLVPQCGCPCVFPPVTPASQCKHLKLFQVYPVCADCGVLLPRPAPSAPQPRPRIICLCGSTRFIETFAIQTWELERQGFIVLGCTLLPMWYCQVTDHFGEATGTKEQCDELHKRKIDLADEVLVLDVNGYIGESTRSEIEYATALGKPVRYLSNGGSNEIK